MAETPKPKGSVSVEGQTVLVTGAAQGLGAGITRHLHGLGAANGPQLVLLQQPPESLPPLVRACVAHAISR